MKDIFTGCSAASTSVFMNAVKKMLEYTTFEEFYQSHNWGRWTQTKMAEEVMVCVIQAYGPVPEPTPNPNGYHVPDPNSEYYPWNQDNYFPTTQEELDFVLN